MYDLAKALAGEGNLEGLTLAPEAFSGTFARSGSRKTGRCRVEEPRAAGKLAFETPRRPRSRSLPEIRPPDPDHPGAEGCGGVFFLLHFFQAGLQARTLVKMPAPSHAPLVLSLLPL